MQRAARLWIFIIVAVAVYAIALSNDVYVIASPPALNLHVVIRKAESIVAFTAVAFAAAWWLGSRRQLPAILIFGAATYSGLIELGQRICGSHESWQESLFDVFCGTLAGYIVAAVMLFVARRRSRADRTP
ncbi:MAG: hypothetical protein ACRENA_10065 [Vulcanimicrobiaceae bacterium]